MTYVLWIMLACMSFAGFLMCPNWIASSIFLLGASVLVGANLIAKAIFSVAQEEVD